MSSKVELQEKEYQVKREKATQEEEELCRDIIREILKMATLAIVHQEEEITLVRDQRKSKNVANQKISNRGKDL